ncbi:MAG: phosphoribosylglycinamide formyltransferase [Phaeodactylibacter sp.]|nr:phosphoribosylglycinamide formyltransferase [Phaeodactylibacter sp.]
MSVNIAIFASGRGSNAKTIIEYFQDHPSIEVSLVISNKIQAPVLEMARSKGVSTLLIDRQGFYNGQSLLQVLDEFQIHLIILAGFLWLVPGYLIQAYPERILNIHPALLPKYGGKGMYGRHVHEAVKAAGERHSGITIHLVDEEYDRGKILFQTTCALTESDTPETIAQKIHKLEHEYFPLVIQQFIEERYSTEIEAAQS